MASDTEAAAAYAITQTLKRGLPEVTADELLLGCLRVVSQFGIAQIGPWPIDLESLDIDWLESAGLENAGPQNARVAYSDSAVEVFDRAVRISKATGAAQMRLEHMLAAFAGHETGLMGQLKATYGITSAGWRAALTHLAEPAPAVAATPAPASDYLSPEAAADALGIHVQTLRGYVRSGKLPARRLAGERAIRIRRADLEKLLEPLQD